MGQGIPKLLGTIEAPKFLNGSIGAFYSAAFTKTCSEQEQF